MGTSLIQFCINDWVMCSRYLFQFQPNLFLELTVYTNYKCVPNWRWESIFCPFQINHLFHIVMSFGVDVGVCGWGTPPVRVRIRVRIRSREVRGLKINSQLKIDSQYSQFEEEIGLLFRQLVILRHLNAFIYVVWRQWVVKTQMWLADW